MLDQVTVRAGIRYYSAIEHKFEIFGTDEYV